MDEIIPFLIFVAFTIFEAIRGRKKKKSRLKKAESTPKEDSVTTENVKPAKTSDFLEGFLSSFPSVKKFLILRWMISLRKKFKKSRLLVSF